MAASALLDWHQTPGSAPKENCCRIQPHGLSSRQDLSLQCADHCELTTQILLCKAIGQAVC